MTTVRLETWIDAPRERCFDLARSQTAHVGSTGSTQERVVEGPPRDLLELGDLVTFEARHFGKWRRLTAEITEFDFPERFVDVMRRGDFRSLRHEHRFFEADGGTRMVDALAFEAPFGVVGLIVERAVLYRYIRRFLEKRTRALKAMAERHPGPLK